MTSSTEPGASWGGIVLRGVIYAIVITLLVLYAPVEKAEFIYMSF